MEGPRIVTNLQAGGRDVESTLSITHSSSFLDHPKRLVWAQQANLERILFIQAPDRISQAAGRCINSHSLPSLSPRSVPPALDHLCYFSFIKCL